MPGRSPCSFRYKQNRTSELMIRPGGWLLFTVPKKGRERRPIINLKNLISFLKTLHLKMEGIPTVQDLLKKDDFLCRLDIKDMYLLVPVHPTTGST